MDDRLHTIQHDGHAILLIDFSRATKQEIMTLLELVRVTIGRQPPNSVLVLADFAEAQIDKAVATRMKEVLTLDRPYVKKSAWVGTASLPKVFYENFKSFSQRDFPKFETREAAMAWLVKE